MTEPHKITLPEGVQVAYIEMNGKTFYLDDSTNEGIAECLDTVDELYSYRGNTVRPIVKEFADAINRAKKPG